MTPQIKNLRQQVVHALRGLAVDGIVVRGGTVEVKQSYFYRCGQTEEKFANGIRSCLQYANVTVHSVRGEDRWAAWPKESYFVAVITPVQQ